MCYWYEVWLVIEVVVCEVTVIGWVLVYTFMSQIRVRAGGTFWQLLLWWCACWYDKLWGPSQRVVTLFAQIAEIRPQLWLTRYAKSLLFELKPRKSDLTEGSTCNLNPNTPRPSTWTWTQGTSAASVGYLAWTRGTWAESAKKTSWAVVRIL